MTKHPQIPFFTNQTNTRVEINPIGSVVTRVILGFGTRVISSDRRLLSTMQLIVWRPVSANSQCRSGKPYGEFRMGSSKNRSYIAMAHFRKQGFDDPQVGVRVSNSAFGFGPLLHLLPWFVYQTKEAIKATRLGNYPRE